MGATYVALRRRRRRGFGGPHGGLIGADVTAARGILRRRRDAGDLSFTAFVMHSIARDLVDLTVSVDHEIVDCAPAARFARRLAALLEQAAGLG
jgi:2-oxoacid dehydrogenases acyltransferase (catalytic domain)